MNYRYFNLQLQFIGRLLYHHDYTRIDIENFTCYWLVNSINYNEYDKKANSLEIIIQFEY